MQIVKTSSLHNILSNLCMYCLRTCGEHRQCSQRRSAMIDGIKLSLSATQDGPHRLTRFLLPSGNRMQSSEGVIYGGYIQCGKAQARSRPCPSQPRPSQRIQTPLSGASHFGKPMENLSITLLYILYYSTSFSSYAHLPDFAENFSYVPFPGVYLYERVTKRKLYACVSHPRPIY